MPEEGYDLISRERQARKREMDLFFIRGIVEELRGKIVDGFITKIYQVNRTDLLLRLRRLGEENQLFISTHPDFHRLHLTEKKYPNPMVPPRFSTYLRKHVMGARITEISQAPYERVVRIALQKKLDAGIIRNLVLIAELTGKGSNILLLEGEKILDCLHFRKAEEGNSRPALPGLAYSLPGPSTRLSPGEVTLEKMTEIASSLPGERWKRLTEKISGISPLLAREIEFLSDGTPADIWRNFHFFLERYERSDFEPRIFTFLGGKKVLSPFPLKSLARNAVEEVHLSMNQAADAYYFETVMRRQVMDQKQAMTRRIKLLLSRLQRRQENLLADREKLAQDLELKKYGEVLTANYPKLRKGMSQIEALDYSQDPPHAVVIPLEEALDPAGNVERYFRKYKKAKRGLEFVALRQAETAQEIAYLESVLFQVEEAEDAEELEAIREELQGERILSVPRRQTRKEQKEKSLPVRRFRSSEGLEIFCGKNNVGNDYILRRVARGNDLWFHAQGIPGSHVLLRVGPQEPKFASVLEAAGVAAFYSRGRGSGRLPVDYTAAKNLRKPKGARPGLVTYSRQKTIFVTPDKASVEKLAN